MAVSLSISITQNSQSVANNTSNVTVKVTATWSGGAYNLNQKSGTCTINGTAYSFTNSFNDSRTTSGSKVIYTKTLDISHNSDGTKTLSASASYVTGVSAGTISASASKTLTTIPRKSTLSVGNGTLGTAQTLEVTKQSSGFTHTITYTCGSASGTICTKSSSTSISFTPPLSLASQNTTGTTVSIKYTITTYNGSTSLGSNSYTKTCSIPSSVKPSCTAELSDADGYYSTFGDYVQGWSRIKAVITATTSYGSEIASYSVKIGNNAYSGSTVTMDSPITESGIITVTATVTDKRGRSGTYSTTITVLAYNPPQIFACNPHRSNSNGTTNDSGAYCTLSYSGTVTSLNSKNTAKWEISYKKSSASSYGSAVTDSTSLTPSGKTYTFAADTGSSYSIRLVVTDKLTSTERIVNVSSAYTIINWLASGLGLAFGKVAELANYMDIAYKTRFRDHLYVDHDKSIYGFNDGGGEREILNPSDTDGNTRIGYGNHANADADTVIMGDSVALKSNQGVTSDKAMRVTSDDISFRAIHSDTGNGVSFGVGSGGYNRGVYDDVADKWMLYRNSGGTLYLLGDETQYKPYFSAGDSFSMSGFATSGWVTSSGTQVNFWIPFTKPIIGNPTITVASVDGFILRQGAKYTHGSGASTYTKPTSMTVYKTTNAECGIRVAAVFSDTTNVTNNDAIGIMASIKITFS